MRSNIRPRFSGLAYTGTIAAALLLAAVSAGRATAATVTVSSTCTFVKAVGSINAGANQFPCTHTGTYGSSDTIVVPVGTFNVTSPVNITRSVTIHGGSKWDAVLQATADFGSQVIHITNPSAVVKMDNLTLDSGVANDDIGIYVEGESDANLNDNNLELSFVIIASFGNTGLLNFGGRVLIQNTLIYLNDGVWGGGVQNVNGLTGSSHWWVAKFVARNSAISYNNASIGGGVWSNGRLDLESTLLQGNYSTGDGGAVFVTVVAGVPSPSCKVGNLVGSTASELDDNTAAGGWSIMSSSIACSMSGSIGSGNSSPYCSPLVTGCPQ